jgi:hypothetical protein
LVNLRLFFISLFDLFLFSSPFLTTFSSFFSSLTVTSAFSSLGSSPLVGLRTFLAGACLVFGFFGDLAHAAKTLPLLGN